MITRTLFLLLTLILLPQFATASSQNQKFQEANSFYSKGDFTTAITLYESLIAEHGYSPGVLYNLGNSYAQVGYPGRAILSYERALRLSPSNSDILGNLEKVQSENGLFTRDKSLGSRIANSLGINQWGMLILVALTAVSATVVGSLYLRISRRVMTSVCIGSALLILLSCISMISVRKNWFCSIMITSSPLLISPFEGAAKVGTAREGRRVFPQNFHGSYVYVVSETGRTGWLLTSDVQPVVPKL
ncbi:tetratricopeptide repeat protein [Desulfosediminicola sp.]|uniref:tetratricopeptide repeat protein n=1 Tax=Desulfosediminicola sp. TaxID=2886825 RepID=UPI003AF21524